MPTSLSPESVRDATARLRSANLAFAGRYPGSSTGRQPVHSFYGGAHLFRSDSISKLGTVALRALEEHAPDAETLANALGLPESLAGTIHARIAEKLRREPIEDIRIDFEDGYGSRPDDEEDRHAESSARETAAALAAGALPPFFGFRVKAFTEESRERAVRTLDLFLTTLAGETGGRLPEHFAITLPKVTIPEQVEALAELCDRLEQSLSLQKDILQIEILVEIPRAILNERGEASLPRLVEASRGRCVAVPFGAYDYTAACGIIATHQRLTHPSCDFARHVMQVTLAGTGIWLSDSATTILPIPPYRAAKEGPALTAAQKEENRRVVHHAWKVHYDNVRRSLAHGFYQGWDLHPAQLIPRYAAVYSFFLEDLDAASERLRNFLHKAAQATLVGDVFDDAATGLGLFNSFLRAVNCGALPEEEVLARSGLTIEELRGRSFARILEHRNA